MNEIKKRFENQIAKTSKGDIVWNDYLKAFDKVWNEKILKLVSIRSNEYLFNELIPKLSSVAFKSNSFMIQKILLKGVIRIKEIIDRIKKNDKLIEIEKIEKIIDNLMKLKNVYA